MTPTVLDESVSLINISSKNSRASQGKFELTRCSFSKEHLGSQTLQIMRDVEDKSCVKVYAYAFAEPLYLLCPFFICSSKRKMTGGFVLTSLYAPRALSLYCARGVGELD